MSSALTTMNLHHGKGLWGFALGSGAGFGASVLLGTIYGARREKWWGRWMPAFFAGGGKALALAVYWLSKGRLHTLPMVLNDVGQAGLNALGINLGVKIGLKATKQQLVVQSESTALGPGATRVAGELPPADPGRSVENISVEELANLI